MRRLVKGIKSGTEGASAESEALDLTGMTAADLRVLAAQIRQDIQRSSLELASVETQIALSECGRVRGRSRFLQQRQHPPVLKNPTSGAALGDDLQIYHDSDVSEIAVRQRCFASGTDQAPFQLEIEVYQFEGGFLSVVQNLPDDLVRGASDQDIFDLSFIISSESEFRLFLRLNIRHGPNQTQLTRSCRTSERRQVQSFDLAEAKLSHRSVDRMWVDVILTDPVMNRIVVSDLIVRRRARAQV